MGAYSRNLRFELEVNQPNDSRCNSLRSVTSTYKEGILVTPQFPVRLSVERRSACPEWATTRCFSLFRFSSPLAMLSAGLRSPTVRLRSTSATRVSAWHNSSKTFKMTPKEIVGKFVWLQVKRKSFPCFFFKRNWKVYEIYRVLVIVLVLIFLPRVDDGTSSRPVFNWSTTEVLAWKDEGEFQPNNFLMALKFLNCSLVTDFYFYALIFCVNFENVIGHWYWYSCLPREALCFRFASNTRER